MLSGEVQNCVLTSLLIVANRVASVYGGAHHLHLTCVREDFLSRISIFVRSEMSRRSPRPPVQRDGPWPYKTP